MLNLTRRVGEKIFIGPDVVVTVISVTRDEIRLGIDAPRSVPIFRSELLPAGPGTHKPRQEGKE